MGILSVQNAIAVLHSPKIWLSTGGEQQENTQSQVAELFNDMEIVGCD